MADLDLVALGEPLVALLPDRPGALRGVPRFERGMAGAECNVLLGMSRLGSRCGLISQIGDDEFGEFVVETLRAASVDLTQVIRDATRPTGVYFKEIAPVTGHVRPVYYRSGSASGALAPDVVSEDYIARSRAFLTTGITALLSATANQAVNVSLDIARAAGVTTVFDPNLRNGLWGSSGLTDLLLPLVGKTDIYLGGEGETRILLGADESVSCLELARSIARLGPRDVVLKRGERGSAALDADGNYFEQDIVNVNFKDAVGAGDAFNAGFLHARQAGQTVDKALISGAVCGAAVCMGSGDFETFPRSAELKSYLAEAV